MCAVQSVMTCGSYGLTVATRLSIEVNIRPKYSSTLDQLISRNTPLWKFGLRATAYRIHDFCAVLELDMVYEWSVECELGIFVLRSN